MQQKERRALDKCFERILHDLDPTTPFLHSLYADRVITEEQVEKISQLPARETKVAMLLKYLPHRGPDAFNIFRDKLCKDYPWLANHLNEELRKLQSSQSSINRRLLDVIQHQLLPLLSSNVNGVTVCEESSHPGAIIQKLGELLGKLEQKCYKALDVTPMTGEKTPLHKLIDNRLHLERSMSDRKVQADLQTEVRGLKRQLRDMAKLRTENDKLKNVVDKQKVKLRDYNKVMAESKKNKQEIDKLKKDIETLHCEIRILRDQLHSSNTSMAFP